MALEIERKFLVTGEAWREGVTRTLRIRQAYLSRTDRSVIRVRVVDDSAARITIKGMDWGASRPEFEYDIPLEEAQQIEALGLGRPIRKHRHHVPAGDLLWEIDVFDEGLVLAEIELPSEDADFPRPDWLGKEVTLDPRYSNAEMALGTDTVLGGTPG